MHLRFPCPKCDKPVRRSNEAGRDWTCPACGQHGILDRALPEQGGIESCCQCGCRELYRQKDFPQWLGMSLLTVACLLFFVFAIFYKYAIAWSVLLGSAALDGIIYMIVGDVVVCYRCGARHGGVPSRNVDPFELPIAEKCRQERIRREQLDAERPR